MKIVTIRDHLTRRIRWNMGIALCGWLLFPLSISLSGARHGPPSPIFFIGFVLFAGAIISLSFFVRCPNCRTRLGQIAAMIGLRWGRRARVNFCPFCGINLDEPYGQQ